MRRQYHSERNESWLEKGMAYFFVYHCDEGVSSWCNG